MPLLAAEPRIGAAMVGPLGVADLGETAAKITVPVRFLLQWDDTRVRRDPALALFDARVRRTDAARQPRRPRGIPGFETDNALRFFARHLG